MFLAFQVAPYERPALSKAYLFPEGKPFLSEFKIKLKSELQLFGPGCSPGDIVNWLL